MAAGLSPNLNIDGAVERAHDVGHRLLAGGVTALHNNFDAAWQVKAIERLLRGAAILLGSRQSEFVRDQHGIRNRLEQARELAVVVERETPRASQHRHRYVERRKR